MNTKVFLLSVVLIISSNAFAYEDKKDSTSKGEQQFEKHDQKPVKSLYFEKNQFIQNMRRNIREVKEDIKKEKYRIRTEYKYL